MINLSYVALASDVAPSLLLLGRRRIRDQCQGGARASDVALQGGGSAHPDRPDYLPVHLNGEPPTVNSRGGRNTLSDLG
jgi:hypothetical protein